MVLVQFHFERSSLILELNSDDYRNALLYLSLSWLLLRAHLQFIPINVFYISQLRLSSTRDLGSQASEYLLISSLFKQLT